MTPTPNRTTFQMSRSLEFFSEKELQMQIGFPMHMWPVALLKELLDNAHGACETHGILPDIEVTVEPDALSVQDNGPGLPASTIERSLNYRIRVSDKAHYVSPSCGQLGNALKCVWAAPYVAKGEQGAVEVVTGGLQHRITVRVDRLAEQPLSHHDVSPDPFVKSGTFVRMHWPQVASSLLLTRMNFFSKSPWELITEYAAFNPHASFTYRGLDEEHGSLTRTASDWRKWSPRDPTSAHWYTTERLRGLIAAYVADERRGGRARTVREFVGEFAGLQGTMKQKLVTESAGLGRAYLHDLIDHDDVDLARVMALLVAMQETSRPVKPVALGPLGEAHMRAYMLRECIDPASIKYRKVESTVDALPVVMELAFGWPEVVEEGNGRRVIAGINWTPSLTFPFPELADWLGEQRVDEDDPVIVIAHIAMPRPDFTHCSKSRLALPAGVRADGKCWTHSSYFTQKLLPDFVTAYPEQTASWDVVFDDRGHLIEPHTRARIGLGTVAVRRYLAHWHTDVPSALGDFPLTHKVETIGPGNRYRFALFIEKEGFDALLESARIADRYDVAIFSTKGQSVTAARALVEALSTQAVTILVVHDFDKSGIEIFHTLHSNTRRYTFQSVPKVIDLGFRLSDVQGLEREPVEYRGAKPNPAINLRACGATEEESQFLVRREGGQWVGDRVELNAMRSDQLITWLEGKFAEVGVEKVVPAADTLADAYRLAARKSKLQQAIDDALTAIDEAPDAPVPDDLAEQVRTKITGTAIAWDDAVWSLMRTAESSTTLEATIERSAEHGPRA